LPSDPAGGPGERLVHVEGGRVRVREQGEGPAVVALGGGDGWAAAGQQLAPRFRVLALRAEDPEGAGPGGARVLTAAARALRLDRFSVLGVGAGAAPALRLALEAQARVERLVLVSPAGAPGAGLDPELEGRLGQLRVPTLVVEGTDDRTASAGAGRRFQGRLPACFQVLVYEAGPEVARDRPTAFASLVGDFLQWGERFTVSHRSQALNP
jgi:pimeloyl-ACP methyl ester carboxylesterase